MKRIAFFLPLITLFLLTACAPQPQVQGADIAAASPTAAATLTSEPTFTPTPTATFTPTPTPTATFTPTPTPITLPVRNGTAVPDLPYEVITAENVHRLREVARYGFPRLLDENPYRLSADGKTIAVGTTGGVEFYDAATHQKTGGFEADFMRSFDMTPDGKFILALAGDTQSVWTAQGKLVRAFSLEVGSGWSGLPDASLSPDGRLLAVQRPRGQTADDKVDVYRVSDGTQLDTVRGMGVQFSPNGKYLATVFDSSVRLYPVAELGEGWERRLPQQTLPWCRLENCHLSFSPDGTLAAVVSKDRVDIYQVETRRLVRQVSGWTAADYNLPQVFFTPDGNRVLIQTPEVRKDRSIEIAVYPQAILVDIASGEWLAKMDVPEGAAFPAGNEVRTFVWKAEGEIGKMVAVADNGEIVYFPKECYAVDEDLNCYTLNQSSGKWQLLKNGEALIEFRVPVGYAIGGFFNSGVAITRNFAIISWTMQIESKYPPRAFAIFDLEARKQVFSSSGVVYRVESNNGLLSVGYALGNQTYVLLESDRRFRRYSFPDYLFHALDRDKPILFLFGVEKALAVNLAENSSKELPFDAFGYGVNSNAIISSRANLLVDNLVWRSPGIRFLNLESFLNSGKTDPAHVLPVFDENYENYPASEFMFSPSENFFATQADGFIRVWAVVPQDSPVR